MKSGLALVRLIVGGLLAAGTAGAILALAGIATPVRAPAVLLFLAVAPAAAAASLLPRMDWLGKVVVAGSASVVINATVAAVMLLAGAWSPLAGLVIVALVSVLLGATHLLPQRSVGSA